MKLCQVYSFRRPTSKVAQQSSQLTMSVSFIEEAREPIWVISFSPYQMFHPMPCRVVEGGVVLVSLGTNNVFFCSIVSILFHEFLVNMPLDAKVHLSIADVWIKLTAKFPWALVHLGGRFFYRIRGTDIIMKTYILVSIYLFILQFLTGGYNTFACIIWFPFSCM